MTNVNISSSCCLFATNLLYFASSSPYRSFNSASSLPISLQLLRGQGRVDLGCFSAHPRAWALSPLLLSVFLDELAELQNSFLGEDLVATSCLFAFGVSLTDSCGEDLEAAGCFLAFGVSSTDFCREYLVATGCFFAFGEWLSAAFLLLKFPWLIFAEEI